MITIHISIVDSPENLETLSYFAEDCVFASQRGKVTLGQSDEKVAVVQIGTDVGSRYDADVVDLGLYVDFISKIVDVKACFLPDGGWFRRAYLGDIV